MREESPKCFPRRRGRRKRLPSGESKTEKGKNREDPETNSSQDQNPALLPWETPLGQGAVEGMQPVDSPWERFPLPPVPPPGSKAGTGPWVTAGVLLLSPSLSVSHHATPTAHCHPSSACCVSIPGPHPSSAVARIPNAPCSPRKVPRAGSRLEMQLASQKCSLL